MDQLVLHEFHQRRGARFTTVAGAEVVADYGDVLAEHGALRASAGVLDLSFRGRVCLTGADRVRFLHGQVTNDIKALRAGAGCYAALVTAKGRMESDLKVYCLADELLLEFEPGLTERVSQRLEKYIVADDVQVVDVAALYGLLSVQGPAAEALLRHLALFPELPSETLSFLKLTDGTLGEVYLMRQPRLGTSGFDLFVPAAALERVAENLLASAQTAGGRACGWQALEIARIEAGVPRFGVDMDETNLPQECGIEARAVSYTKGCYIGQEVLNRIHTLGHVNRELSGLVFPDDLPALPARGDKLVHDGKEAGYVTSATASPTLQATVALGYVRKEVKQANPELRVRMSAGEHRARIVPLPFRSS